MTTYIIEGNPRPMFDLKKNEFAHPFDYDVKKLSQQLKTAHSSNPFFSVPIGMSIVFYMRMPNNFKRGLAPRSAFLVKPRVDDLVRVLLESCENILFRSSELVVGIDAVKVYSELPRTEIEIMPWEKYEKRRTC